MLSKFDDLQLSVGDQRKPGFGINRTTVISHLDRRDVPRRRVVRKTTDATVAEATSRYGQGLSLVAVAEEFDVHARPRASSGRRGDSAAPRPGRVTHSGRETRRVDSIPMEFADLRAPRSGTGWLSRATAISFRARWRLGLGWCG